MGLAEFVGSLVIMHSEMACQPQAKERSVESFVFENEFSI